MPDINKEKVRELINEIRGSTAVDKVKEQVKQVIAADKKKAEEAKEKVKKQKDEVDAKLKKIKDDLEAEEKMKAEKKKKEKESATGGEEEESSEDDEEEEEESEIEKLTKQMTDMAKEIEALKKRKNYRTKPPKAKKVDELDDFIKQNRQVISKDFEVVI